MGPLLSVGGPSEDMKRAESSHALFVEPFGFDSQKNYLIQLAL